MEDNLQYQQKVLLLLKHNFIRAQSKMKQFTNQHHSEWHFEVWDWLFWGCNHTRTLVLITRWKEFSIWFTEWSCFLLFHIHCLKNMIGNKVMVYTIMLELDAKGEVVLELETIIEIYKHWTRKEARWVLHIKASKTNQHWKKHLFQRKGHAKPLKK